MSLQRACCCGEPTICSVCSCASSYRVNGINLSYSFTFNKAAPGAGCTCRYREYDISVNIVPTGRVIATKVAGGSCCYRARFDVSVSGYVNVRQYYDSGSYCPPVINMSATYPFTRTTCACLTVACNSKVDVCSGPSRATALVHTIEIGDFVVDCNVDLLTAGDCDSCTTQQVFALRCIGGRFQYATDVACLNSLSNVAFIGFYGKPEQLCGTGGPVSEPGACYANLDANIQFLGPFSVIAEGECAEGVDDYDCIDQPVSGTALQTFASTWPETLRTELQGPCGSVDWSGRITTTGTCLDEYDVLQSGAPGFWTYV
jgi:hypothetical protein